MKKAALFLIAFSCSASAAPPDPVGQARGAALQANARRAVELVKEVDAALLPEKERHFVTCIRQRFAKELPDTASEQSFADRALSTYRTYWHSVLLQLVTREAGEQRLETELTRLLDADAGTRLDALEPMIAKRLKSEGWHSLQGRTGLLRDLMMWKDQDEKVVPVQLPEGEYRVRVNYLNDFKSFGWSHYATCGRSATGGWATDQAIFAVVPRYENLDGEEFQVTFLGHETSHFADKSRFPELKSWELEYRAKLTELVFVDQTRSKVLTKFVDDQGDNPASPHSYANRAVLGEMVRRLGLKEAAELYSVDLGRLQSAARLALVEDSRRRELAAPARN